MSTKPAPIVAFLAARRFAWVRFATERLGCLRRLLPGPSGPDKSLEALTAIENDELHCLSESGLRLRREARSARRPNSCAAAAGWLSAGAGLLASGTGLAAEQVCRPAVTIAHVQLSGADRDTAERRWTARIAVDVTRCAQGASGSFQLALLRLKENAPDLLFRERLQWSAPTTTAEIPLSTDEAVERSWIEGVSPCLCAP